MIYIFIYSSFFGSKNISKIYFGTFNFWKKSAFGIIASLFAMIIKSVIYFFIYDLINKKIIETKINYINKKSENDIENNNNENKEENREYNNSVKTTSNYLRNKLIIFFIIIIIVLIFEWFLVFSFCFVYKNSQNEFLISILVCYFYSNIISFIYCLIPSILRKYALKNNSETFFKIALATQII